MSDVGRSWEKIQEKVFKDIEVGIATLRTKGTEVFTFISQSADTENGLIWALHCIFIDPDNLSILHDAFRRFKSDGKDLTAEAVLDIATSQVAYYMRDHIITDTLGQDSEEELDKASKEKILGSLYMRSLITLASESLEKFERIEPAGIEAAGTSMLRL